MRVHGYGRASRDVQVMSTPQQHARVLKAFDAYKVVRGGWENATFAGWYADEATSRDSCFRTRNQASLLLAACQPGDVIMVSNYDRIFVGVIDACETLELLDEMKVDLLILDSDFDTSTNIGRFAFKVLALVKELEVHEIRRRIREALRHRRDMGLPSNAAAAGWRIVNYHLPGKKYSGQRWCDKALVPDYPARRAAEKLLEIKRRKKLTIRGVLAYALAHPDEIPRPNGKPWTHATVQRHLKAAERKFVLPNGRHEAAPLPPNAIPVKVPSTLTAYEA